MNLYRNYKNTNFEKKKVYLSCLHRIANLKNRKFKSYVETRCFTVNTPHSPFAVGKTRKLSAQTCPSMSKVAHGCVLVSQNGAEMYCGQSSSWSDVLVVVYGWENRGQCLDKCTGGGHNTCRWA